MKHIEDLLWSNALPDIQDHSTGSPCSTYNDQITHNISDPDTKSQSSCAGTDKQLCML